MHVEKPAVPQMLQLLGQAYQTLLLREQPAADDAARLRTIWSDIQWYSERFGSARWTLSPRADKWSFADIVWHITEQAIAAAEEATPEPVRYYIDHGKEHVGQIAELWFLIEATS
jgi:hypothetical protein